MAIIETREESLQRIGQRMERREARRKTFETIFGVAGCAVMAGMCAMWVGLKLDDDFNNAVNPSSDPTMEINQIITEEGVPTLEK